MGFILDVYYDEQSLLITMFKIISIGIRGDSSNGFYTSTLHLSLWKLELTTSLGWRKNGKQAYKSQ